MNDDTRETTTDVEQALGQIEARAAEIRAEQLERALTQLRAQGDLTDEQAAAVERLSERLAERLLAVPRASLRQPSSVGDGTVETAAELFG
ncbi:glutamyl-tRNA reductase [Halomicroarcula sp. F13]|uniref:Glutamyl-tRNA reductase n=1 Tax=Haloarcula rubra TaxID=2487747 RepID=A0AAW4PWL8_9EURY|nr:glutamyl-tRNA reductase [Halomicroarcula rubra]